MTTESTETKTSQTPSEKDPTWKSPEPKSGQWWKAKELGRKPHELLDKLVQQIEDDQSGRYAAYREFERLLGNADTPDGDSSYRSISSDELIQNELQNTVETLWAQIFKNRIVPAISTSEASWDEWDRARGFSRWIEGSWDDTKVFEEVFPLAGANFIVHGTGFIRVGWKEDSAYDAESPKDAYDYGSDESGPKSGPKSGKSGKKLAKVYSWSVNPKFFAVDRHEAKHGKPRSCYFKDHVDRTVLFETYKEDREDFYGTPEERCTGIWKCKGNDDRDLGASNTSTCDMLTVREAYHQPSTRNSKDGRHVIWVNGCTLVDEPYTWDRLPVTIMRFGCRTDGFYGDSAVRRLAPTQKLLDKLNMKIDEAQDVMGVPRILVGENGNGLKLSHIDDIPGGILSVNNISQVRDWNAQCASQEMYADRDSAPGKMRALLGISDFAAQQQIPQGMRDVSGAMLERWVGEGQARHAMDHAEYENAVKDLTDLYLRQAEDCQEMGFDMVATAPGENKSSVQMLNFSEVCIGRQKLKIRVQSMSQLPQTFAGKVEAIEKLKKAGYPLNEKAAMRMIEIPDPSGAQDLLTSADEIIFKNLCHMSKTGQYLAPLPYDDLDLIIRMTTDYINWYRRQDAVDYDRVAILSQYIDDAVMLKGGLGSPDANAPPPMPPGMPPMGPEGMPMGPEGMPPGGPPGPPGEPPMGEPPGMPMPPMGMDQSTGVPGPIPSPMM